MPRPIGFGESRIYEKAAFAAFSFSFFGLFGVAAGEPQTGPAAVRHTALLIVGATIGLPHAKRVALQTGGVTPPLRSLDLCRKRGRMECTRLDTKLLFSLFYRLPNPLFL